LAAFGQVELDNKREKTTCKRKVINSTACCAL